MTDPTDRQGRAHLRALHLASLEEQIKRIKTSPMILKASHAEAAIETVADILQLMDAEIREREGGIDGSQAGG